MWENDLTAPRFRNTGGRIQLNDIEMAEEFLKLHPNTGFTSPKQVLDVLKDTHIKIRDVAQNRREGFEIPYFGVLKHLAFIPKYRIEKNGKIVDRYIDFNTSLKFKKKIAFTNFHTDGYQLKIRLDQNLVKYKAAFREYWYFTASRDYARESSKSFRTNFKKFI